MNHPHRHRLHGDAVRLERWHRNVIYGISTLLAASGILWLAFHFFVHYKGAFGDAPHPLTAWWLKLHGAAAMLALLGTGSMTLTHMRRAWHLRRNRGSGTALAAATIVLAASGYLLYYAGSEAMRAATSIAHWTVGLACIALLPFHVLLGRRGSRRRLASPVRDEPLRLARQGD